VHLLERENMRERERGSKDFKLQLFCLYKINQTSDLETWSKTTAQRPPPPLPVFLPFPLPFSLFLLSRAPPPSPLSLHPKRELAARSLRRSKVAFAVSFFLIWDLPAFPSRSLLLLAGSDRGFLSRRFLVLGGRGVYLELGW
jgi:hypothetical protein